MPILALPDRTNSNAQQHMGNPKAKPNRTGNCEQRRPVCVSCQCVSDTVTCQCQRDSDICQCNTVKYNLKQKNALRGERIALAAVLALPGFRF